MSITADTLAKARSLRVVLDKTVDATTRDLVKAWSGAWHEIADEWASAVDELVQLGDGDWPTQTQVLRAKRAQKAMQAAREALDDLAKTSGVRILRDVSQLAEDTDLWEQRLALSQLPQHGVTVDWSRLDSKALAAIVKRTTQQVESLLRPLPAEQAAVMRQALIRGIAVGDNPRQAAALMLQRVGGVFDGGRFRAENIARTEMLDASRAAAKAARLANSDVLRGWMWMATKSSRSCPACLAMDGQVFDLDTPGPEGHQQCVLPGAIVSGPRAQASTTRWFEGEVIDVETRSGRVLSVTPNHPILTPQGWVRAGELREGLDVIASAFTDGPALQRRPDDHQVPARIEDVAKTLGGALSVRSVRVPTAPEDFHGDGAGSEVHVVRTHGGLWPNVESALAEKLRQSKLMFGNVGLSLFAGGGDLGAMFGGLLGATYGVMGRPGVGSILLGRAGLHGEAVGLGEGAPRHTCGAETGRDHVAGDAEGFGDSVLRFASEVAFGNLSNRDGARRELSGAHLGSAQGVLGFGATPDASLLEDRLQAPLAYPMPSGGELARFAGDVVADRVVHVSRRAWSGHVYNLQTATGWYVANGIVTHNCRCTAMPITKSWRDLGFDIDEPASLQQDAEQWFWDQPATTQTQIMGPERLRRLQSGDLKWGDLAVRRENPGWRPSWTVAPLQQAG